MPTLPVDDLNRLRHMLDAAKRAQAMSAGRSRRDLDEDEQLSLALQRLIEILGEAASRVTPETRARSDEIRWAAIAGMRNRLIHAYFDINLDTLWTTVQEDLPPLVVAVQALLGPSSDA